MRNAAAQRNSSAMGKKSRRERAGVHYTPAKPPPKGPLERLAEKPSQPLTINPSTLSAEDARVLGQIMAAQSEKLARSESQADALKLAVGDAKDGKPGNGEPHIVKLEGQQHQPHMTGNETGLPPDEVPVPLSTVIPVFLHEERVAQGAKLVRMMTPAQLHSEYGDDAMCAMCDAFRNFTAPDACFPDMQPGEVYRHGLAIYLLRHEGSEPPHETLSTLIQQINNCEPDNKIMGELIDPEHNRKREELRVAVAIRESARATRKTRDNPDGTLLTIVIALVLAGTCDVWHTKNHLSPGHRNLLRPLRKKLAICKTRDPKKDSAVERTVKVKLEAEPTEKEIEEQALDDEFAAMSFEELLAQEKGRGGNVTLAASAASSSGGGKR